MSVSDYCLHTGSQHGDDHTGALMESDVTGSTDMTLTREYVYIACGGDNERKCSLEIPTEKPETVSEEGLSTTMCMVVLVYTAINTIYIVSIFQMVCRQW